MFAQLFDYRAPFWQGVARLGDLVVTNVLFLVACLPVVTIGAAFTALYDTAWHLHDERGGGPTKIFWGSFRTNFWKATAIWAFVLPLTVGVALPWLLLPMREAVLAKALGTLLYLLIFPFFFYLQARFDNTVTGTLKNAFVIPLVRLPYSAGVLAVTVLLLVVLVATAVRLPALLWLPLLGGFGMAAYAVTPLLSLAVKPWVVTENASDNA